MADPKKPTTPGREHTDGSLRDERSKTDEELARRRAVAEREADAVVSSAQERANATLASARARADRKLENGGTPEERKALSDERALEDETLENERSTARERVQTERVTGTKVLNGLLHLEREQTDLHLGLERDLSDAALASRDEFLGMVSHDLRTLLGGIALSAAVILRDAGKEPAVESFRREAQRTQRYTARMNRLIGDLLDVVSIEAGKLRVAPANDDAVQLVREVLDTFQPLAAAKGGDT